MRVEDLPLFPNSDQFGTCSYNAKSILLYETPVMEAQVHLGCSGFTGEIEITVRSAVPDSRSPRDVYHPRMRIFLNASAAKRFHIRERTPIFLRRSITEQLGSTDEISSAGSSRSSIAHQNFNSIPFTFSTRVDKFTSGTIFLAARPSYTSLQRTLEYPVL